MSGALWAGALFGLSAGLTPGPLFTLVVAQTLKYGVREGVLVSAAPILTDMFIIALSFFVLSGLSTLGPVLGAFSLAGGAYVLYLAWETAGVKPVRVDMDAAAPRSLRLGIIANFLNPHPYLFWATVGMPLLLKYGENGPAAPAAFILIFYVLLVGSKVILAAAVGRFRNILEGRAYLWVMRGLGLVLALFGVFLLVEGLTRLGVIAG